jgi:hypothetical protein
MDSGTRDLNRKTSDAHIGITAHARGVHLADIMLLVAATALGIVGTRSCYLEMREIQTDLRNPENCVVLASPTMTTVSLALLASQFILRRRRFREMSRCPGFAANGVTALVITMMIVHMVAMNRDALRDFSFMTFFNYGFFWPATSEVGEGVLICWITMACTGCWRPEPNWIDRTGRVLEASRRVIEDARLWAEGWPDPRHIVAGAILDA